MTQGLAHQRRDRLIIEHIAICIDEAVLPVGGVRIESNVGNHTEFGKALFQGPYRARYQPILVPGLGGIVGFLRWIDHRKQCHRGNSQFQQLFRLA